MDTPIFLTSKLAPHLLGPIAIAAYSYMALVPVIQSPIMRALTTPAERKIKMKQLRSVSKAEKIIFPIIITAVVFSNPYNRKTNRLCGFFHGGARKVIVVTK